MQHRGASGSCRSRSPLAHLQSPCQLDKPQILRGDDALHLCQIWHNNQVWPGSCHTWCATPFARPPSSGYQGQPLKSLFSRLHTNREKVPQNGLLLLGGGVDITVLASHFLSFFGRCGCKGRPPTNLPGLSRSNEATKMGRIYRWPCFPTRALGHSLVNLTTAAVTILPTLCQIRMRRHNMNNAAACCLPGRAPG
jgi:hypothetical protein